MKWCMPLVAVALFLLTVSGCEESHEPWREQKLLTGQTVKIKSMQIAWGVEHDEPRTPEHDCFVLQFVYSNGQGSAESHAQEADDVFELIRPVSEQWGFASAELMAYATTEPDRHYDLFYFQRSVAGKWSKRLERH